MKIGRGCRSLLVTDSIDSAGFIIGYKQGAVGHNEHIDGPSPCSTSLQPSLSERFIRDGLVAVEFHDCYAVADRCTAVPRSMFSDKDLISIF